MRTLPILVVAALTLSGAGVPPVARTTPVVSWAASIQRFDDSPVGRTVRQVVHTSVGGSGMRIRLSNVFGTQPVTFGRAYAGLRQANTAGVRGSHRELRFAGGPSVTVAPGAEVWSDPLRFTVPPLTDLVISVFVSRAGGPATGHSMALQTNYSVAGDHAADVDGRAFADKTYSWWYLDALVVNAPRGTGAVAALGDSITDGWQSTYETNTRWPDYLARLLAEDRTGTLLGVANAGMSGNRVLRDGNGTRALDRLDRDVLSLPGVRTLIVLEGVNDIKGDPAPTAAELIAGYREIIDRAHRAGIRVVGATVLPFQGWGEWTPAAEVVRREVNTFILTGRAFDASIDMDSVLRNPYDHSRMFPPFDGGDHIHPNDKGMQAIAESVDLPSIRSRQMGPVVR
jgi:lysophospholipase L1-like esterase